ncbi:MAG: flavodoxin family protein [Clostridiales bacterium]|nr:flavodoxin family protein [Clostridiales bacterium]
MNIGIIVYSQTGNTLSVAERVEKVLKEAGHTARVEKIEVEGEGYAVKVKSAPDVAPYDAVIFASPVHGFSISPPMKAYLSAISDLSGKKVYCFVTQQLKKDWMGGNRSIKQIRAACRKKGADIISSGIVHWSSEEREKQIDNVVGLFREV